MSSWGAEEPSNNLVERPGPERPAYSLGGRLEIVAWGCQQVGDRRPGEVFRREPETFSLSAGPFSARLRGGGARDVGVVERRYGFSSAWP
jgi:hypothetical protein